MKRVGVRNQAVADAAGVHLKTVSHWLADRYVPDEERLAPVAELLGVSVAWLRYGGDAAPDAPAVDEEAERVPASTPRVSAGLPYRVRVWLQGFLLEITKGGATDAEVEEARQLLTSPEVFVYFSGGAPKEFNEDDVLDGMEALGEVVRRTLRKRGRKL